MECALTDATQQRILDAATEVFAARGFTAADKSGELNGQLAFEANARAYLNAMWANWRAAMVLELDTSPRGQLLTGILIAMMAEASGLVITSEEPADVGPITDATIEWIDRLTS
jgi:hypothetical protein